MDYNTIIIIPERMEHKIPEYVDTVFEGNMEILVAKVYVKPMEEGFMLTDAAGLLAYTEGSVGEWLEQEVDIANTVICSEGISGFDLELFQYSPVIYAYNYNDSLQDIPYPGTI